MSMTNVPLAEHMRLYAKQYADELKQMLDALDPHEIERLTDVIIDAYNTNKQVFVIGNGGSASAASHMACDLGKGTAIPGKRRLRAISLTDNMAMFSAIANDFGYENVFVEQLKNVFNTGDVLIGISASGNSPNVVKAIQWANEHGGVTASIVGFTGGAMKKESDICIFLANNDYGPVEDGHLIINHMISTFLRKKFDLDHHIASRQRLEE